MGNFKKVIDYLQAKGHSLEGIAALLDTDVKDLKDEDKHSMLRFYQVANLIDNFNIAPGFLFSQYDLSVSEMHSSNIYKSEIEFLRSQAKEMTEIIKELSKVKS